jgi:ATP-dependent RNA helicase HelY
LTDTEERRSIREVALERTIDIPDADLGVLGYDAWLDALERGVAAHHAGMLPVFKEVVEELFSQGLLKVVFATETLALGINMPARTVVLERLVKWNGETHAEITPGEYTQLTGRAGRRGIDVEGDAVVVWHNGLDPRMLAGLASTRTYPLRSSFAPSYNMAVNLVGSLGRSRAREVLETSFAQFQADRGVVGMARQLTRDEDVLDGYRDAMTCHLGDFAEYSRLRRGLSDREKELTREGTIRHRDDISESLGALMPGDVVIVPSGRRAGPAVVLDTGFADRDDARPLLMTLDKQVRRIAANELTAPLEPIARVKIPKDFSARSAHSRRNLASALRDKAAHAQGEAQGRPPKRRNGSGDDALVLELRAAIRSHPCHGCDDREDHARWAERYYRLQREIEGSRRRIEERTNTIARQFDRVLALLSELGYVAGTGEHLQRTDAGALLARIYTDQDLLASESIRRGLWDSLDAPSLAAVAASLVYESRNSDDSDEPHIPNGPVRKALDDMMELAAELASLEKRHRLNFIRTPDLGFCWAIHRWTSGVKLERVLRDSDLAAGDFVRWVKQVIDLLGQIAQASAGTQVQQRANDAIDAIMRGVVAYSSVA